MAALDYCMRPSPGSAEGIRAPLAMMGFRINQPVAACGFLDGAPH